MPYRTVESKYGHTLKAGPWKVSDNAEWLGRVVRIVSLTKDGKEAHVWDGALLRDAVPLAKLRRPR